MSEKRKPLPGRGRGIANIINSGEFDSSKNSSPAPVNQDFPPNLADCSILCRHWPGVQAEIEKLAAHLHSLGPRPILEALREVADGADLDDVLADYSQLDSGVVHALGGDKFPPPALHEVMK